MKKNIFIILFIALYLSISLPLNAENKPVTKLDLSEAINISLENNLTLQKQRESNTIFKLKAKKEFTYFLPNFVAESNYTYNSTVKSITLPNSSASFTANNYNTINTAVSFIQPISDLYKTSLNYKIAKEKFAISLLDSDLKKEFIINLVSKQYFDLIRQKKVIDLNCQNISTLEAYYTVAKDHYDAGIALARDYMKIQIEIDNAKHRLFKEKNKYKLLNNHFKEILGIDLDENIEITEQYEENNIGNEPLKELQEIAIENRPEIKQLNKSIHITQLNKKVQIAEYIPHVNFFVSYVNQIGSEFLPDNNVMFGVNAQYDFWQWNRKFLNVKEQRAEIKTKELSLKEEQRAITLEVESQLNTVLEAKDLIEVSKRTVNLSKENLRITNDRYNIGLALITDLLDDQTALLESQLKLITSELEYQKSLIDLDKTLGILQ